MDQQAKQHVEIRKDDSEPFSDAGGSYIFPIAAAVTFVLLVGAIGGYYFYKTSEFFNPYSTLYSRLGINIARSLETVRGATGYLDRLKLNHCEAKALQDLSKLLAEVGLGGEAARALGSYNYNCPYSRDMVDKAYGAFDQLGDHGSAIGIAETMLKNDPTNSHAFYLRANSNEKAKNYRAALPDYLTALEVISLPSRVAYSQFYRVSHMYELTDRPCDAVGIEDTYVYYNPKFANDGFVKKRITDLWRRGNCAFNYAVGSGHLTLPSDGILTIEINGIPARMRIDMQNVSTVITEDFASKARITTDTFRMITPNVATRNLIFASGDAQVVKIDTAVATLVPVRIAVGAASPFGAGIDGQIGSSLLNRYDLRLTDVLDLAQRVRN